MADQVAKRDDNHIPSILAVDPNGELRRVLVDPTTGGILVTMSGGGGTNNNIYTVNGTISGDRTVMSNGHTLRFTGSNNEIVFEAVDGIHQTYYDMAPDMLEYYVTDGGQTSNQAMEPTYIQLRHSNGGFDVNMTIGNNGIVITDNILGRGVIYSADYSANYTNRSLVDKQYVDTRTAYVQLVNQAMTNLNSSTSGTQAVWNTTPTNISDTSLFIPQANGIQVTQSADYEVYSLIYSIAHSTRVNVGLRATLNGTGQAIMGAGGYIRNQSGHNESSTSVRQIIKCNAGDVINVEGVRLANTGTVTNQAGRSVLIVKKIN